MESGLGEPKRRYAMVVEGRVGREMYFVRAVCWVDILEQGFWEGVL